MVSLVFHYNTPFAFCSAKDLITYFNVDEKYIDIEKNIINICKDNNLEYLGFKYEKNMKFINYAHVMVYIKSDIIWDVSVTNILRKRISGRPNINKFNWKYICNVKTCNMKIYNIKLCDDDVIKSKSKILVSYNCGHDKITTIAELCSHKKGCLICSGKMKKYSSDDKFKKEYLKLYSGKFSAGSYKSLKSKTNVSCTLCGCEFNTSTRHLLTGLLRCPGCDPNRGFNPNKSSIFYIHKIYCNNKLFYKFGITNNINRRLVEQQKNLLKPEPYIQIECYNGKNILELESKIHYLTKDSNKLSKVEFRDGYTETFDDSYFKLVESVLIDFSTINNIDIKYL